jgi:ABC-2 type transport system ATP-binding protein
MSDNIIELVELSKSYGSHVVVDKLSLAIKKGEVFGLLGPNGAGKTTAILMIMGLTEPDSGIVNVCGINPAKKPIEVKRRVGYLPEDVGFYDDMTGLENLIYTARLNGFSLDESRQKAEDLLSKIGLSEHAGKKAGKYSRGMRQRLGLADVLIKNPEVIILDEPTLGIDPSGIRELLDLIIKLSREEGITVLFSSHNLYQVQQVCDRVGLFVNGKLLAEGDIQKLSYQLFKDNAFNIEVGISGLPEESKMNSNDTSLYELLQNINGVKSVKIKEEKYNIECSKDISSLVAKTVIESGFELNYLNKRQYGLDDIYYRYFEGVINHEQ